MTKRAADLVSDSLDLEYQQDLGDAQVTPKKAKQEKLDQPSSVKSAKSKGDSASHPKPKPKPKRQPAKKCKGCRKKLTPEEQAPNWPGCTPCKRALDNITKAASKQGADAVKFVQEARQDDAKCYNMIQSYLENCPETVENFGKKRGQWSVVRYMERVKAASGLVKDCIGELMWDKLYLEHAQTTRGGRLREEEALLQWKQWEESVQLKDPSVYHDYGGPNGKLRVWVKTQDLLIHRSEYMREKSVDCVGQEIKKGSDADVDKFRAEIVKNHGKNMGFEEVGAALCKNGGGSGGAFSSNDGSGFLLDVLQLLPDVETGDGETEGEATEPKDPKDPAPKPWVERDRMVSAAIRAAKTQATTFTEKGTALFTRLSEWKDSLLASSDDAFKSNFAGEIKMLEVRLEALDLCFNKQDANSIKQFIGNFSTTPEADMEDGKIVEIGNSPPCELYSKLRPVSDLDTQIEKYNTCTQPKHLRDRCLTDIKAPLTQLMSQATKAEKSLKTAKDQLRRAAAKAAAKPQPPGSDALALFDQGAAQAKQIHRVSLDSFKVDDMDFSRPFIVTAPSWIANAMASVQADLDGFRASFDIGRKEKRGIRASKPVEAPDQAVFNFLGEVEQLFGGGATLVTSSALSASPSLSKQVVPGLFGIDSTYDKVSAEAAGMSCARLTVEGTRLVVMTQSLQLTGFMQRKGVTGTISTSRQAWFLRSISLPVLAEYVQECELFAATLQAGDLLYCPYGSVQGELVQHCTFGVRIPLVVKSAKDPHAILCVKRRTQEAEASLRTASSSATASGSQEIQQKASQEVALLKEIAALCEVKESAPAERGGASSTAEPAGPAGGKPHPEA
ncbi:unnamed protein product [Durusdinium trenchii]|uniref:WD repeat-containing protein C25H1.08c n=2 Tax=Durusdinium trenchii TaxID=1381693 RepID=A0ABP0N3T0_9DINO